VYFYCTNLRSEKKKILHSIVNISVVQQLAKCKFSQFSILKLYFKWQVQKVFITPAPVDSEGKVLGFFFKLLILHVKFKWLFMSELLTARKIFCLFFFKFLVLHVMFKGLRMSAPNDSEEISFLICSSSIFSSYVKFKASILPAPNDSEENIRHLFHHPTYIWQF
jgi:hypothetical protein